MGFLPPILVELKAVTHDFQEKMGLAKKEMHDVEASGSSSFTKLGRVGGMALAGVAAGAVLIGIESVKMADEYEKSHARLESAVKNAGGNFEEFGGKVKALDRNFEQYGRTSAETEGALARLTQATNNPKKAMEEMGLVADIAAARHIGLEQAATLVGKVMDGNVGVLKRFGLSNKDATGDVLTSAGAVQMLTDRFGGAAATQADTFGGKISALKAQASDLGVQIGMKLIPVLEGMGKGIAATIGFFERHTAVAKALGVVIGGPLVVAMATYIALQAKAGAEFLIQGWTRIITMGRPAAVAIGEVTAAEQLQLFADEELVVANEAVGASMGAMLGPIGLVVAAGGALYKGFTSWRDGGKSFVNDLTKAFGDLSGATDATLVKAGAEFVRFGDAGEKSFKQVAEKSPATAKAIIDAMNAAGEPTGKFAKILGDVEATSDRAAKRQKDFSDATGDAASKMPDATGKADDMAKKMDTLAQRIGKDNDALTTFNGLLDRTIGGAVDASTAAINYQSALQGMQQKLHDNGVSLDITTQKGRDNKGAIDDMAKATIADIEAQAKHGATMGELKTSFDNHITDLRNVLTAAGMTTGQVDALVKQYGLVPAEVLSKITLNGAQAAEDAATRVKNVLGSLNGSQTTARINIEQNITEIRNQNAFAPGGPLDYGKAHPQPVKISTRASGGPVAASVPYWVGEEGPELFVPQRDGDIIATNKLASMGMSGGGGQTAVNAWTKNKADGGGQSDAAMSAIAIWNNAVADNAAAIAIWNKALADNKVAKALESLGVYGTDHSQAALIAARKNKADGGGLSDAAMSAIALWNNTVADNAAAVVLWNKALADNAAKAANKGESLGMSGPVTERAIIARTKAVAEGLAPPVVNVHVVIDGQEVAAVVTPAVRRNLLRDKMRNVTLGLS